MALALFSRSVFLSFLSPCVVNCVYGVYRFPHDLLAHRYDVRNIGYRVLNRLGIAIRADGARDVEVIAAANEDDSKASDDACSTVSCQTEHETVLKTVLQASSRFMYRSECLVQGACRVKCCRCIL